MINGKLIICLLLFDYCMCVGKSMSAVYTERYCAKRYECDGNQNTVCKFKCQISTECHGFSNIELTDEHRQYVLDIHNFYRNLVASGYETRGGHSKASNMMVLNYEHDHEEVLYCWLRRCIYAADKCRSIAGSIQNGQNMFRIQQHAWWTDRFGDVFLVINRSITAWYEEVAETDREIIDSWSDSEDSNIRNVSQMLWANTVGVGCGYAKMPQTDDKSEASITSWHFFCNYHPSGNVIGEAMYRRGEPITECPSNSVVSKEYTSLCGEMSVLSDERQIISVSLDGKEYEQEPFNKSSTKIVRGDSSNSRAVFIRCNIVAFSLSLINLF